MQLAMSFATSLAMQAFHLQALMWPWSEDRFKVPATREFRV